MLPEPPAPPHSGVAVDIPLIAWTPVEEMPDQSVAPDIAVTRTFAAQKEGVDVEMAAVLGEIGRRR